MQTNQDDGAAELNERLGILPVGAGLIKIYLKLMKLNRVSVVGPALAGITPGGRSILASPSAFQPLPGGHRRILPIIP